MATTLTSLAMTIAAEKSVTAAMAKLPALKAFSTSFKAAEAKKGSVVTVPFFAAKTAAAFNKSTNNYADGSAGVSGVDITLDKHYVAASSFEDIDFVECDVPFWAGAGDAIGKGLAKGILGAALAEITVDNFDTEHVLTAANAAKTSYLAALRKEADDGDFDASEAVLLLNPTYFAAALGALDSSVYGGTEAVRTGEIPGLYGFRAVICVPTLPTAENLVGAIVHQQALGVAGRLLKPQGSAAYDEIGYSVDDNSGLAIGWRRFTEPATGTNHYAGEALFGVDVLNGDALIRIVSAANSSGN